MNISQISFKGHNTAKAAYISDNTDIDKAIEELQIPHPKTVIVLVGVQPGSDGGISSTCAKPLELLQDLRKKLDLWSSMEGCKQASWPRSVSKGNKKKFSFLLSALPLMVYR